MTCAELLEVLPDLLDEGSSAEIEAHLRSCQACAELVSDLNTISTESKRLRASDEPDPRVWDSIEAQLRREGLIRAPHPQMLFLVPTFRKRWATAAWLLPVTALLITGVALFVARPAVRQQAQNTAVVPAASNPPRASNTTSGQDYDHDDNEVLAEVEKRAPMMLSAYKQNLRAVNAYIRDAQHSVEQNPADNDAQQYLMEARGQKAMIYQMALERSLP